MTSVSPSPLLRQALLSDAVTTAACALLMLAGGGWLALSAMRYRGGETSVDGGSPSTRAGADFGTLGVAWQSLWFDAE